MMLPLPVSGRNDGDIPIRLRLVVRHQAAVGHQHRHQLLTRKLIPVDASQHGGQLGTRFHRLQQLERVAGRQHNCSEHTFDNANNPRQETEGWLRRDAPVVPPPDHRDRKRGALWQTGDSKPDTSRTQDGCSCGMGAQLRIDESSRGRSVMSTLTACRTANMKRPGLAGSRAGQAARYRAGRRGLCAGPRLVEAPDRTTVAWPFQDEVEDADQSAVWYVALSRSTADRCVPAKSSKGMTTWGGSAILSTHPRSADGDTR